MDDFDDLLGMPIEHFAEELEVTNWSGLKESYRNPGVYETVFLNIKWCSGGFEDLISDEFYAQRFDYDELLTIANELETSAIHKIAEMLAIRNAWIDYYKRKIDNPYLSIKELRTTIGHDISFSFLILSSSRWWEHPWALEQICLCAQHQTGDRAIIQAKEIQVKENLDIRYFIQEFKSKDNGSATYLEFAKNDVKRAKKRIADLHSSEIRDQESIINQAMSKVRELKKAEKASIGHPKRTEEQQERSDIAKKFVGQWVNSLMDVLSLDNCSELVSKAGGKKITKMTWWRWKNNKTLPPLRLLYLLLNQKVSLDGNKTIKLCDVKTTPSLRSLISLIELI